MTRAAFLAALAALRIDPRAVSLDRDESEAYVCRPDGGGWIVYYGERGQETGRESFAAEGPALDRLLALLRADRTTRRRD